MKCRDCKADFPEHTLFEGKCSGCYRDSDGSWMVSAFQLIVIIFLLVLIFVLKGH